MSDEMARSNAFPFDQRIAEAVSMGIPVEEIAQHLSDSKNETHKFWVQQYKGLQTAERAKARAGETTSDNTDNKDQSWLDQAEGFVAKHPVASAVVGTVAAGAGGLGAYAIKSRMDTAAKIREAKALAKLEPSEAVKIQREQLDLAKQKFQAEQDALIKGETANAIKAAKPNPLATAFEEKFKIPFSQAEQFAQGKITSPQDAEIIGNAMKSKLGAAVNPMSGAVSNQQPSIPSTVNPINTLLNAAQPPAAPGAPVGPPASNVGETVATGGNVAQAVKQVVADELDQTPVAPPQGMREQYKRNKANPIGPGGYNYFASQVGHEAAPTRWSEQYGEKNVPHAQVQSDYSNTRYPPKPNPTGAKTGGAFGTPKYIPEFIKGGASLGNLGATAAAAAIPSLAAAGYQAYKGNKEKVDAELKDAWNSMKSLVTMPVDVAKSASKGDFGPFKDMLMSMNPGTLLMNEMNKRDEAALQRMIQSEKVGAGRGIAPPSAYKR